MSPVRKHKSVGRKRLSSGVSITIKNLQARIAISPRLIKQAAQKALSSIGKTISGEIAIFFVNDRRIKNLNRRFLGKNLATDVLCFDLSVDRKGGLLADIFISTDTAAQNSRNYGASIGDEINLYVIHAVLHLFGYRDDSPAQRQRMQEKQRQILKCLS